MRQQLLCSTAAIAIIAAMSGPFTSQAWAADAAKPVYKAPAAVAVVYDWTGFYVGRHIGLVTGKMSAGPNQVEDGLFTVVDGDVVQTLAGLHAGYNQQSNNFVYGIEADINVKVGEGNFQPNKLRVRSPWDASLRARVGVLMNPQSLLYVTGGLAFGHFTTEVAINPEMTSDLLGGNRVGWTAGGGFQYALDDKWSARIEYRYTDWGSKTVTWINDPAVSGPTAADVSGKLTDNRINIGLTYKVGGTSELIGKAPAAAMAIYNWTGFYVGGHVGTSAGVMKAITDNGDDQGHGGFTQVLAGGHAGYDYQLSNNIVIGVEGDVNAKFGGGWFAAANSLPTSSWDASIRARLGYLVTPRSLFYATGGIAFGRFTTPLHEIDPADLVELLGGSRTGWTLGSGVQYVLDSNWSVRIEYRYTDWGSKAVSWEGRASTSKLTDSRAITGLSYKFGGPARFVERDAVAMNWTGFYAGGHVGGTAASLDYGHELADFTQVLVGGHAGYNYQLNNNIVIGVEGDLNGKLGHGFKFDDLLRPTSPWDASIRARLGYAATPRSLVYVTGGFAVGRFSTPQSGAQEPNDPPEEHIGGNRTGWTWGGGIQYALDPNWSARIEYRRTDWGTKTLTNFTNTSGSSETADAKLTDNRVAVGVSYKFGDFGKGPVVTRY